MTPLTAISPPIPANVCPLCGQSNQCAMELQRSTGVPQGPCWCTTAVVAPSVLERIPAAARGTACVCAQCASDNAPHH